MCCDVRVCMYVCVILICSIVKTIVCGYLTLDSESRFIFFLGNPRCYCLVEIVLSSIYDYRNIHLPPPTLEFTVYFKFFFFHTTLLICVWFVVCVLLCLFHSCFTPRDNRFQ